MGEEVRRDLDRDPPAPQPRIGVYICHCGTNISGKVNVGDLAAEASAAPSVAVARHYQYMCSDPGQEMIVKDIGEHRLTRVVICSCSPRMHEPTFRAACFRGGLNPYLMTMANIREHCSWVTVDPTAATAKAKALVNGAILRAAHLEPLQPHEVPYNPVVMVIGGGIAGIQTALELANAGRKVYLVEKEPSIGGHMAKFDKTFPTLDCAACILTPKMVTVGQHKNIELLTYSEVDEVSGYVGSFKVRVRRKARLVDEKTCNGCGTCWQSCSAIVVPRRRRILLGDRPTRARPDGQGQRRDA
jgi:heterodisulfide reductase subunit A